MDSLGTHISEALISSPSIRKLTLWIAGLLKQKHYRAERMIKAVSLFIEGKASLRDWWLEMGHKFQNPNMQKRSKNAVALSQLADAEFGVQEPAADLSNGLHDWAATPGTPGTPGIDSVRSSSAPSRAGDNVGEERPILSRGESHPASGSETTGQTTLVSRNWHERNSSVTTFDNLTEPPNVDHPETRSSVSFDLPPNQLSGDISKELQDALLSTDLKGVFSRSSNLIREAIGVEGVVFFDASVGSFGGSSDRNVMEERAPGAFHVDKAPTSSEDELRRRPSVPDLDIGGHSASDSAQQTEQQPEKCCNILGFSTRTRSSLRGHQPSEEHKRLPESILRRLLKRYPHGKSKIFLRLVLNFGTL